MAMGGHLGARRVGRAGLRGAMGPRCYQKSANEQCRGCRSWRQGPGPPGLRGALSLLVPPLAVHGRTVPRRCSSRLARSRRGRLSPVAQRHPPGRWRRYLRRSESAPPPHGDVGLRYGEAGSTRRQRVLSPLRAPSVEQRRICCCPDGPTSGPRRLRARGLALARAPYWPVAPGQFGRPSCHLAPIFLWERVRAGPGGRPGAGHLLRVPQIA